jgi:hypothetical protein
MGTDDEGNRLGIGIYRQLAIKRRNVQQGKFNNERSMHAKWENVCRMEKIEIRESMNAHKDKTVGKTLV